MPNAWHKAGTALAFVKGSKIRSTVLVPYDVSWKGRTTFDPVFETLRKPTDAKKKMDGLHPFDRKGGERMNITGKIAVVTGAGSGIGQATALELARRGTGGVVGVDRSERVFEVMQAIDREVGRPMTQAFVGNSTDAAFRARVFDEVTERFAEEPSICVPAAGITRDSRAVRLNKETGRAEIYPMADFREVLEVNLMAPVYWGLEMVARIALARRRRGLQRWEPGEGVLGTVVFIGSVSAQGNKGQIAYAASKAGLEGAAATLMKEAIFHGVRCAVIHPGFTDTPMVQALGKEYIDQNVLPYTQLRRLIRPEEVADAICFMISNSAVSGELWADAGWHPLA
jgi:3-oxoacyl-[acyl-carrier protein] reductase